MKLIPSLILLFSISSLFAQTKSYYLSPEDQKYYKNDSLEGKNQFERIDSLVQEVNKVHGEMAKMKTEIQELKKEVEDLKAKSK
jgi:polyhydroxyalkanoate synthesis regulator phasin